MSPSVRWRLALVACSLATVVPLWVTRHLPFTDLPEHVATIATLRHWFDDTWPDSHIYEVSTRGTPYIGYQVLGALLTACVRDPLLANRLLMTGIGLGIPWATRFLVVAFGGDERLALFGCAAFWCRALVLGFLPFMSAVPLTIFVLALAVRQARAPTRGRAIAMAAISTLVFYLHLVPFLLVVGVGVALEVVIATGDGSRRPVRFVRRAMRLAWLGPGLLAALWWAVRTHTGAPMMGEGAVRFLPARELAEDFPVWSQAWRSKLDVFAGAATWVAILSLALHRRVPEPQGLKGLVLRATPLACALVIFALVPFGAGVTAMLNVRVAVFFVPLVAPVLRPNHNRLTAGVLAFVACVTLALSAEAAVRVWRADRAEMAGFDQLIDRATPGAPLLALEFDRGSAFADFSPWLHAAAYHRLRGGGVASYTFAELPHWPIHFRPEARPPRAHAHEIEWNPCVFRNAVDGVYYSYVLVRGSVDPFARATSGPRWQLVDRAADWSLFERVPGQRLAGDSEDLGPCAPPAPPRQGS